MVIHTQKKPMCILTPELLVYFCWPCVALPQIHLRSNERNMRKQQQAAHRASQNHHHKTPPTAPAIISFLSLLCLSACFPVCPCRIGSYTRENHPQQTASFCCLSPPDWYVSRRLAAAHRRRLALRIHRTQREEAAHQRKQTQQNEERRKKIAMLIPIERDGAARYTEYYTNR